MHGIIYLQGESQETVLWCISVIYHCIEKVSQSIVSLFEEIRTYSDTTTKTAIICFLQAHRRVFWRGGCLINRTGTSVQNCDKFYLSSSSMQEE